jgi:hypothetical protein
MVNRHDDLWSEWDRLAKVNEDDPRTLAIIEEASELERWIVATPASTPAGLAGKRRVIDRAEMESSDDLGLIETILELDAERIAAR